MYDLTIIGSGPGGYASAMRAAELGAKVCIIEKRLLGGTCLNIGCIPTKTIMRSLDILQEIKRAPEFGIDIGDLKVDIKKIQRRKAEIVLKLRQGLESLLKSKGIEVLKGTASFSDSQHIDVDGKKITSKYFLITTGSMSIESDTLRPDHNLVLLSEDLLRLDKIPKSIAIIGGGAIGCEFASIYNRLGSDVTIIELKEQLLPKTDKEIARRFEASLKKKGINIFKGARVSSVEAKGSVSIALDSGESIEADIALLCIGRIPNTAGLGLDKAGVKTEGSKVLVDEHLRTNISNIYAVGDVTGRNYLAHTASYEGIVAVENIFGSPCAADYSAVPECIYTYPGIGSVGITEEAAKESGIEYSATKFPLAALSMAHVLGETEGLIKIISDAKTGRILGAQIFGLHASELISNFVIAIKQKMTTKDLSDVIFPHPTISEGILETVYRAR
ncbi:MAG: dihydrolipoyl dehydrogenase [Candidatus Omnitrophica bacterium]|nr:dihydrolipoyl dehydrogenase [Candidatus Omnitrophota bacterium]